MTISERRELMRWFYRTQLRWFRPHVIAIVDQWMAGR